MDDLDRNLLSKRDALEAAKAHCKGNTGLARALSDSGETITPQAISQWKEVPTGRVLDVERVTGIARHILRPDIYPPTETAA